MQWQNLTVEREDNSDKFEEKTEVPSFGEGSEYNKANREMSRRKRHGYIHKEYDPNQQPWLLTIHDSKRGDKKLKGSFVRKLHIEIWEREREGAKFRCQVGLIANGASYFCFYSRCSVQKSKYWQRIDIQGQLIILKILLKLHESLKLIAFFSNAGDFIFYKFPWIHDLLHINSVQYVYQCLLFTFFRNPWRRRRSKRRLLGVSEIRGGSIWCVASVWMVQFHAGWPL